MTRGLIALAILTTLSCSSGGDSPNDDANSAPDYGTTPGKVLEDFPMTGYLRWETAGVATDVPFGPIRVYAARERRGARYAFIHTAGFWCSTCVTAAKEIVAAWPALATKAVFIEILTEGASPTVVATKSNLDVWVKATQVPFTAAIDAGSEQVLRAKLGVEDTCYIVDLTTMKIVDRSVDWARLLDELRGL